MKDNTKGAAAKRKGLGAFFVYLMILVGIGALGFSIYMLKNRFERQRGDEIIIAQQNKEIVSQLSSVITVSGTGYVARKQNNSSAEAEQVTVEVSSEEVSKEVSEEISEATPEPTSEIPLINTPGMQAQAINTPGAASASSAQEGIDNSADSLPMIQIDGISCVGILTIGERATYAIADISSEADDCYLPYYISGTPSQGNLLIRGVSSNAQFGAIKEAEPGDEVSFIDATGIRYNYETVGISKIEMSRVQDALNNSSNTGGVVVSSESMRESSEIDLQLYYDEGDRYRVVMDCKAKREDY